MVRNQRESPKRKVDQTCSNRDPSQCLSYRGSLLRGLRGGSVRKLICVGFLFLSFLLLFVRLGCCQEELTSFYSGLYQIPSNQPTYAHTYMHPYVHTHVHLHLHIYSPPTPTRAHICTHTQCIFISSNLASINDCVKTALGNLALSVSLACLTHLDCTRKWCKGRLSLWWSDLLCSSNPSTMLLPQILVDTLPQLSARSGLSLMLFHPLPFVFPCQVLRQREQMVSFPFKEEEEVQRGLQTCQRPHCLRAVEWRLVSISVSICHASLEKPVCSHREQRIRGEESRNDDQKVVNFPRGPVVKNPSAMQGTQFNP